MLNEKLLHFIWQNQLLSPAQLVTTEGEVIVVEQAGVLNHNAGPDFLDARLKIGNELWAGHVEIHIDAKDWIRHQHHFDRNYDSVILHVVMNHDHDLNIPTLELQGKIQEDLLTNYQTLMDSERWIPCADNIQTVSSFTIEAWKNRVLIERIERKSSYFKNDLENSQNNWEECHYRNLLRSFGHKVNKDAFNELGVLLPYKILKKHAGDIEAIEALLFGAAGLLTDPMDEYQSRLADEFRFLKHKYGLSAMNTQLWKYATLRPGNFPTIRIAQLASLIKNGGVSFNELISLETPSHIYKVFDTTASTYWDTHYRFGAPSKTSKKRLGKATVTSLFINHIVPMLYSYGWYKGLPNLKEKAISWLEEAPAEKNVVISKWAEIGLNASSAFDTQSLLELKNEYCSNKNCLNCGIGNSLLRNLLRDED